MAESLQIETIEIENGLAGHAVDSIASWVTWWAFVERLLA